MTDAVLATGGTIVASTDVLVTHTRGDSTFGVDYGGVYLFLGAELSAGGNVDATTAEATFYNSGAYGPAGVGSAGDMDGDGFEDLWISYAFYGMSFWLLT